MKNVVVWGYSQFNWLWLALAEKLKAEHGSRVHFICFTPQNVEDWKKKDEKGVVDSFVTLNRFFFEYGKCKESAEAVFSRARALEERYGTFLVDVLQTDRHLGRGFSAAGTGHPRSQFSEKAEYLASADLFNKVFAFWEEYFDETQPELVIGIASGIAGKTCSVVARKRGIAMRVLTHASYRSYFYWAADEYFTNPLLKARFDSIRDHSKLVSDEELIEMKRLPWAESGYRDFIKRRSLWGLGWEIAGQVRTYLYRRSRRIVSLGNYKLRENINYLMRVRSALKEVSRLKTVKVADLSGVSFVFVPLHVEPESSMGMMAPEFNEQMALVEMLAKNLPAGVRLVVKEHLVAVGRRPKEFYSTLAAIPNVLLLDPQEYALEAARLSRCVAVITGTLGAESAILGIPVISFGRHNNYNFLPHVRVVDSWMELRRILRDFCLQDTEEARKKRQEDGRRYLAALKAASFDLSGINYLVKGRKGATPQEAGIIYESLMQSLKKEEAASTHEAKV